VPVSEPTRSDLRHATSGSVVSGAGLRLFDRPQLELRDPSPDVGLAHVTRSARGSIKASRTEAVRWAATFPSARRWRCRSTPARTRHGKGSGQAHKVDPDAVDAHLRARYPLMGGHLGAPSVSYHPIERDSPVFCCPSPTAGRPSGHSDGGLAQCRGVEAPQARRDWLRDPALGVETMGRLVVRSSSRPRGLPVRSATDLEPGYRASDRWLGRWESGYVAADLRHDHLGRAGHGPACARRVVASVAAGAWSASRRCGGGGVVLRRIEGLIGPVAWRTRQQGGGRVRTSNVASGAGTPDPGTPVRDVLGSGIGDVEVERIARSRRLVGGQSLTLRTHARVNHPVMRAWAGAEALSVPRRARGRRNGDARPDGYELRR